MNSSQQVLATYIGDLAALEKSILEMVERQARDQRLQHHPQAQHILDKITSMLRNHTRALDAQLPTLGHKTVATLKEALGAITGLAAGLLDRLRTFCVSKMLRDNYAALSLDAISYTMLHTTALSFKDAALADLAKRHLQDLTPLIVEISQTIPLILAKELAHSDPAADPNVGPQAARNTHETWQRDSTAKAA